MRSVIQHLAYNLAAHLGVVPTLHLNKRWAGVLIEKEVVERPALAKRGAGRNPNLAADKQPAARHVRIYLLPCEQLRVVGD